MDDCATLASLPTAHSVHLSSPLCLLYTLTSQHQCNNINCINSCVVLSSKSHPHPSCKPTLNHGVYHTSNHPTSSGNKDTLHIHTMAKKKTQDGGAGSAAAAPSQGVWCCLVQQDIAMLMIFVDGGTQTTY